MRAAPLLPNHLPSHLPMQEWFRSLQGEGLLVGTPSSFLRLSGCNLRCRWCDTPKTSWAPERSWVAMAELLEFCREGPKHVVVTGGEPMLFPSLLELCSRLREAGHHLTIETAGTIDRDWPWDLLSVSPKLAHSTPVQHPRWAKRHEALRLQPEVLGRLLGRAAWQLKFVVRTTPAELAEDLGEIEDLLGRLSIGASQRDRVLLMPCGTEASELPGQYAVLQEHCDARGFRLGRRLHIELWGHRPGT